jgi:PAS domain S-box-containing protein
MKKMLFSSQFIKSFLGSVALWLGAAVSIALYHVIGHMVDVNSKAEFEYQTNNAQLAIEARIQSYVDVLRATRAMFHSSRDVTRQDFRTYVEELDLQKRYPGINNLNYAPLVPAQDRPKFESAIREEFNLPEFSIKPAGARPEYHPLIYVEPMAGNHGSLGFDLASNPKGQAALAQSRDSGELISSGRLIRIIGSEEIVGLAMRMPLYRQGLPLATVDERRAAYYGSVGAGFDIAQLMHGAIEKNTSPGMRIKVYDLGRRNEQSRSERPDAERLLFDNAASILRPETTPAQPATMKDFFIAKTSMTVGSREWQIEYSIPKQAMLHGFDAYLPGLALICGLLGSILIYSTYYSLLTARRRAIEIASDMTKDLRASKADLAEAQHMAMLGSWLLDPASESMTWSDETYRIFGMDRTGESPGYEDFLTRIDEADRQRIQEGLETCIRTGTEFNTEHRITRRDGSMRWVQTITRPGLQGYRRMLRGTIMDITERKHNLEALKRSQELLRDLTAHQDRIKEDERKRIAREIHDELGQTLLALRIDVSMLDTRTANTHPKINDRVRAMLHHIDTTVKTVRTIINNLRPAVLDLGLNAAVEWQVEEFRRRSAIACDLVMDTKEFTLSDACATTLFRILQESLTNVIRHARATHVRIELYEDGANLVMKITDNGIGLYPQDRRKSDSFGLVGIEERVLALEGKFLIDSAPDKGTSLTIFIPLEKSDRTASEMIEH